MKIKSLVITTILLISTIWSQAQQINPVPDYVFRNQMSVGRNAVTDTAAYFSIGPRYGATKGFMPPIVGDTATFSSGKRNGLLIFSVQKNKFLYWDSVRVQWSDMAGSSGAYIVAGDTAAMLAPYLRKSDTTAMLSPYYRSATASAALALKLNISDTASMLSPYYRSATASAALATKLNISDTSTMLSPYSRTATVNASLATKLNISDTSSMLGNYIRHAGYGLTKSGQSFLVDTLNIATRAWRQKGIDSIVSIIPAAGVGGSGTTNYVAKFTASGTIGNSQIFDNGTNVGIGTTSPAVKLDVTGSGVVGRYTSTSNAVPISIYNTGTSISTIGFKGSTSTNDFNVRVGADANDYIAYTNNAERLRIFANGRVGINTITDAGYQLDVNGTLRTVNGANFATTSGNVGIGNASPSFKLSVNSSDYTTSNFQSSLISAGANYSSIVIGQIAANSSAVVGYARDTSNAANSFFYVTPYGSADGGQFRMSAAGNVGIGFTSNPSYKLDINGTLRSVNGANFATTSGNVGIGTASPDRKLDVRTAGGVGNINIAALVNTTDNVNTGAFIGFGDAYNAASSSNSYTARIGGVRDGATDAGYMSFFTRSGQTTEAERMRITSAGELLINTTSDAGDYKLQVAGNIYGSGLAVIGNAIINTNSPFVTGANIYTNGQSLALGTQGANLFAFFTNNTERGRINSAGEWIIDASGTDAGDYKLQVVGNARIGTGKLDIASNTTFGIGVARSGTSEVAGQIYNSNGILYFGAESSAGGQIFTGSSAYAAVIGSGANYPLQFAVNNTVRGGFNTGGELMVNTTNDQGAYVIQANGSVYNTGQVTRGVVNIQGVGGQLFIDSTTNLSPIAAFQSLSGSNISPLFSGSATWNTSGSVNAIDLYVTNTASGANSNFMQLSDGTNIFKVTKDAGIITGNPSSGTATKWRLGSRQAGTVALDTTQFIEVEIGGTFYRLAIVTPL